MPGASGRRSERTELVLKAAPESGRWPRANSAAVLGGTKKVESRRERAQVRAAWPLVRDLSVACGGASGAVRYSEEVFQRHIAASESMPQRETLSVDEMIAASSPLTVCVSVLRASRRLC